MRNLHRWSIKCRNKTTLCVGLKAGIKLRYWLPGFFWESAQPFRPYGPLEADYRPITMWFFYLVPLPTLVLQLYHFRLGTPQIDQIVERVGGDRNV